MGCFERQLQSTDFDSFFLWGLIGITVQSGWILSGKIGPCAMLEAGGPAHMR